MRFADRAEAGQELARKLLKYSGRSVVFALPRGGIVPAYEVARELGVPLNLILVKKIGHPYNPEYALCALAEGGEPVCSERSAVDDKWLENALADARRENERRRRDYFSTDFKPPKVAGKTVIVVDDGIATGLTMEAAIQAIRRQKPSKVVVAVPVAPQDSVSTLRRVADEVIVLDDPENFAGAVGAHYIRFPQVEDDEVIVLLNG